METIEKEIVQDADYSKYLEELKDYYNLKNKYTLQKNALKNKLFNSKNSIESKKKTFSKHNFKCVNCNKEGGTIFYEDNKILRVTCGNTSEPCDLNIEIVKMRQIIINEELYKLNSLLKEKKNEIILKKLNFLFNYIDEDKAIEVFEELKMNLSSIQENYNNIYLLYNSITKNNNKTKELLNEKNIEYIDSINKYKELINLYYTTKDSIYLKDAIYHYNNKLKILTEFLLKIKYHHNRIEYDEEYNYLIQEKYNLNNLEVIKKP